MVDSVLKASSTLLHGHELWELTVGRLTEVSGAGGGAGLTLAASFVRRAQSQGRSLVWLSSQLKPFYPPDMQRSGVSLERLPLLFLPRPADAVLVASKLVSSGGFDLLICDLASWKAPLQELSTAMLSRLGALARHHRAIVVLLTAKPDSEPSLGCAVALRLAAQAQPHSPSRLQVRVLKDKRGAVGEGKTWNWHCTLPEGVTA